MMNGEGKPDDLPSVDTNQSGNTESQFFPCITCTQKPPRRIRKTFPIIFESKEDSRTASCSKNHTEIQCDPGHKGVVPVEIHSRDSSKRKPLHLPLSRKISNKFSGNADTSNQRGRPMWNVSSRIENRTHSLSNITLSSVRSGRTISTPSKHSTLERSKQNPSLERQESVFERLYREGKHQKVSLRPLTAEVSATNRRQTRIMSPPKTSTNRTLRKPRRSGISSPLNSHREEITPRHRGSHIDRLPSIVVQSRNQSLKQPSSLKIQSPSPTKLQRRRDLERASDTALKSNEQLISREDVATWKKISAKTCELVSNEAASDNLNALISQLLEEQSISPTQVMPNKRTASLNLLMKDSLATETFEGQKSDHMVASIETGSQEFITDVLISKAAHSSDYVYKSTQDEEFESAIAFNESSDGALLIDTDVNESLSSNSTTAANTPIEPAYQGTPSYSAKDADNTPFAPPKKGSATCSTNSARIDLFESDIQWFEVSPQRAHLFVTNEEKNLINPVNFSQNNCTKNVVLRKPVLSRSCEEIMKPNDVSLIQTLSNLSSVEEKYSENDEDSSFDESMISLNSISSSSLQGYLGNLNNNIVRGNGFCEVHKSAPEDYDRMNALQSMMFRRKLESFLGAAEFVSFNMSNAKGSAQMTNFDEVQNFSDSTSATIEDMRQYLIDFNKKKALPLDVKVNVSTENGNVKIFQPLPLSGSSFLSAPHGSNNMLDVFSRTSSVCSKAPQWQKEIGEQEGGSRYRLAKVRSPEYILRRYPPERIAKEIGRLRVALYDVHSKFRDAGITNREVVRDLKQSYRGIIFALRNLLNSKKDVNCKSAANALGAIMVQCVEQFVTLINNKVVRHDWLPSWDKGCLLRLKADFIRYLYEIFPENESYRRKCHEAYRSARSFFLENGLKDRAEWVYLNMNYSAFLYMIGETRRAQFINERLLNTLVVRRCGAEIQEKLLMNLKFYNQL